MSLIRSKVSVLLSVTSLLYSADFELQEWSPGRQIAYTPPQRIKKSELQNLLIPDLKGIVLVPSKERVISGSELEKISGIDVIDIDLPASQSDLEAQLQPYLGQPLTLGKAQEIKNIIARFYEDNFHPLIIVLIPTQDITYDVLQLVVIESKLGQIKVEGNRIWSNLDQVKDTIQLKTGESVNDRVLTADLNFLNRSPYRQIDAVYEPGEDEKTTDILFLVQDIKPYQFYVGSDNTGLKSTISTLMYAGFTTGNCFNLGHTFTYQYTTSDFHAMQAHTAQYIAPLPNLHLLNLYGGYATVHPAVEFPSSASSGFCIQTSARYVIPLLPTFNLKHEVTAGFDYKRTNSDALFIPETAILPFNQTVNLTQFMAGYSGSFQKSSYVLVYLAELYYSPFSWMAQQSNYDFGQLRPGARHKYVYGRGAFSYYQKLPASFYLAMTMRAQMSSTSLLPSEQFGLGGYETVRGYHERVLNEDGAILLSAEIHTPTWKIIPLISRNSTLADGFQMLAFVDYAWGSNHTPIPGQPKSDFLAGVGPALRYYIDPYLNCRLDWGIKLHRSDLIGTSFGYLHFSAVASY